jgi:stage II sporulation protein D
VRAVAENRIVTLAENGQNKSLRLRRARKVLFSFVIFVAFILRVFVAASPFQAEPAEGDLEAASAGRTIQVALGLNSGHRIAAMPIEVYVARVLAGEGESRAEDAAQQALAIAIRTYTAANAGRHRREGFDLCDTTHCQVMRPSTATSRRAALATAGQLLLYDGQPAEVFYSAACGGRSEAASQVWPGALDRPYLRSLEDDVCQLDPEWTVEFSSRDMEQALHRAGFAGKHLKDVTVERRSQSGRVTRLQVSGLRPDVVAGNDFRAALGPREIRSTAFTVKRMGRMYRFVGRGYGHGVGLCVLGAARRAARGESAFDILTRYYPGLQLGTIERTSAATRAVVTLPSAVTGMQPTPRVTVRAQDRSSVETGRIERLAIRARDEIATATGITAGPFSIEVYDSIDSFRRATGLPWWVSTAVGASTLAIAPESTLTLRGGIEQAIREGVAQMLLSPTLSNRAAWIRVGAARYFARPREASSEVSVNVRCPSDAELMMAVSALSQRDAESRAETCFARALKRTGDWRQVR